MSDMERNFNDYVNIINDITGNNILITDIINNELELLSNYSKRAKEHKTLIKTNDKKKKM